MGIDFLAADAPTAVWLQRSSHHEKTGAAMLNKLLAGFLKNPVALIGAASPLILNAINTHKAELEKSKATREAAVQRATQIATDIGSNADALLFHNREAMFGIVFRGMSICDEDPELAGCEGDDTKTVTKTDLTNWAEFQKALVQWKKSTTSRQAQVSSIFGEEARHKFDGLLIQVEYLESMVNAAYFRRPESRYFIEHTGNVEGDECQRNKNFLIKLFEIDEAQNPNLIAHLKETCKGCKNAEEGVQNDFRCKYSPICENLERELAEFGEMMLARIQEIIETGIG